MVVRAKVADDGGETQEVAVMVTEIQASEGHPADRMTRDG